MIRKRNRIIIMIKMMMIMMIFIIIVMVMMFLIKMASVYRVDYDDDGITSSPAVCDNQFMRQWHLKGFSRCFFFNFGIR